MGKRWVGANSNPKFRAVDDDLLPDVAVEHAGAVLVHAARNLVDGLELENFKYVFDKALEGKFIDRMDQNQEIFARYMNDPAFAKVVAEFLRKQVYEQIRAEAKQESAQQGR